ncbi:MAG: hypothetical protein LIO94_06505 [Clostridiales bacterium]|nr:hypothetical protein [Clostridiales bacterium]MCC8115203.1 hypothetical protein [Bacteroidales bacterium]
MARVELQESGVVFDKESHTYQLNGKMLSGITDMIQQQLFPNEYKDIPWHIVEKAGEYGTQVHESIEDFEKNWNHDGTVELQDYISLCKEYCLVHERSEYTVTDGVSFASNIDKVYRVSDNTFDLADIKTYGQLTPEKLQKARWQLSVYAMFFEFVNPKAKVNRLMVIHIRNKQRKDGSTDHIKEIIFVDRIPSDIVKELLIATVEGRQFLNPYDIPPEFSSKEGRIRELILQKDQIEKELGEIKSSLLQTMVLLNITRWATEGGMKIVRKQDSTRSSFDLAAFQKKHPDIDIKPFYKTSRVSGSVTITV